MKRFVFISLLFLACLLHGGAALAATAGVVRGIVHDPHHRPVANAKVRLQRVDSDWSSTAATNGDGEFRFANLSPGRYSVEVDAEGFRAAKVEVLVGTSETEVLHFPMEIQARGEQVQVRAMGEEMETQSSAERVVTHDEIESTPGATRTDSLAVITEQVPGAVMVHNQLHVRGGHEVLWMVDGVPLPNTNIATNVGPQFDPKDMESMDIQRGAYNAEFGDRAYGVFNVIPKAGFDRNREAELTMGFGSQDSTDDHLSFGDHTQRLAYYASVGGTRTNAGLETNTPRVLHDLRSGGDAMGSVIYNATAKDQVRLTTGYRRDWFQVPDTEPEFAAGVHDTEFEQDAYGIASWMHTFDPRLALTVSPFYHFNSSDYEGSPEDAPVIPRQRRGSGYGGVHSTVTFASDVHDVRVGMMAMGQHDNQRFSVGDGVTPPLTSSAVLWGDEVALFGEDQWRVRDWLTLSGGLRFTRFAGEVEEHSLDPRVGASVRVPKAGVVLRAFYGRYYQAPPLLTLNGPTLALAAVQGFGFKPLHGERDEQMEFGAALPVQGWTLDADYFVTRARNYFDHDPLGESNIFFPLTVARGRVRGWEASVKSPVKDRVRVTLNYSHQWAQALGSATGGLINFTPPPTGWYSLDHDQRDTLTMTTSARLGWRTTASVGVQIGSGFLDGDGPGHLPAHATVDLAATKQIRERWTVGLTVTNVGNARFLIDRANTFGGTHYQLPREVYGEVRFRWKY